MGVAFTGVQPLYYTIRADTSANLRADLDVALLSQGWGHVTTLTNGFVYGFQSPQGLVTHCRVQDVGGSIPLGPFCIEIQFQSSDDSRKGFIHRLVYSWGAFSTYQAVIGPCQLFMSVVGVAGFTAFSAQTDGAQNCVAGGIPFIPQNAGSCAIPGATSVNECWWSSGPYQPDTSQKFLRSSRYCTNGYTVCYNGVLFVSTASESYNGSPLQIGVQAPTNNVDSIFHTAEDILKFGTLNPLTIDALIIFRSSIIGVMWDAFVLSKSTSLDNVQITTETDVQGNSYVATWMAYNYGAPGHTDGTGGGTHLGTLYNLFGSTPTIPVSGGSNYAY